MQPLIRAGDQVQPLQPVECQRGQLRRRLGLAGRLAPEAAMLRHARPHEVDHRVAMDLFAMRQMTRHQQGDMGIGAFARQHGVGEAAVLVHQGQPFGTLLGLQAGGFAQPGGHRAALLDRVGPHVGVERVEVDDRVVEQAARQVVAPGGAAGFVAVEGAAGHHVGAKGLQPRFQCGGCFVGVPGGRPAHGGEHPAQGTALHVVEDIVLGCSVGSRIGMAHKPVFVAGHLHQHAQPEQGAAHGHQLTPLARRAEGEHQAALYQCRLGGQRQQALAELAQRDLRLRPLQHCAGQAQQRIASAVVAGQAAGGVARVGGPLVQPRAVALHLQRPARFPGEPLAQDGRVLAHRREVGMARRHQRGHQQRPQRGAEGFALLLLLPLTDGEAVGAAGIRGGMGPWGSGAHVGVVMPG